MLPHRTRSFICLLSGLSLIGLSRITAYAQFQRVGGNPFEPPAATLHYARNRDYHVEHLQLVFIVHPDTHSAEGTVTHTLAPLRDGLSTIVLDAGANLQIKDCTLDGAPVTFEHNGDKLILHAPSPLQRGKYVKVSVHYIMPSGTVGGGANGVGGFKWIDRPLPTRIAHQGFGRREKQIPTGTGYPVMTILMTSVLVKPSSLCRILGRLLGMARKVP